MGPAFFCEKKVLSYYSCLDSFFRVVSVTFCKEHRYIIAKPQKKSNFSFMGVEQISTSKSPFKDLSKDGLISKAKFTWVPS